MGFIESLMTVTEGSSLHNLLETIYAPNSVLQMSGKAIRRALRGHFLADGALKFKLLFLIFLSCKNFKEPTTDDIEDETLLVKTGSSSNKFIFIYWGELEIFMMVYQTKMILKK